MAAERRPQILAATVRVIAERGLDGTRLSDVAAEAGVSVGTVQHYFGTRERLLMQAFAHETGQAVERWLAAGDAGIDGWDQVLALIEAVLDRETFRQRWTRWLEFWAAGARDPTLRSELGEMYEHWRGPFRRAIRSGLESGAFSLREPIDDVVDRTVAAFDGFALQVLLDAPGMSLERMRDLLVTGLADDLGLRPRAPRRGAGQRRQKPPRAVRAASIPSRPRAGSSGT
jgi:AcrR family transcriptional regulator